LSQKFSLVICVESFQLTRKTVSTLVDEEFMTNKMTDPKDKYVKRLLKMRKNK
jgi:hypothetical protein